MASSETASWGFALEQRGLAPPLQVCTEVRLVLSPTAPWGREGAAGEWAETEDVNSETRCGTSQILPTFEPPFLF